MADKLIGLFSDELDVPASDLNDQSSPDTVEQWDSLAAMRLVAAIEAEFKVRLSSTEIMKMRTIKIARDVLREKGVSV
jgi:acyl carrier protein